MKRREFDRLLLAIREENVNQELIREAANRVLNSISSADAATDGGHGLESCADFQKLIPTYLQRSLSPGRALLVEDHLHACVACRHVAQQMRLNAPPASRRRVESSPRPVLGWVLACALLVGVLTGVFAARLGLLPGQHVARGAVENVDGSLYYLSASGGRTISPGYKMVDGDEFRTGKNSRAAVRLNDGSFIEMGERSQFSISQGWRGPRIHLTGGNIIVQAAAQPTRHLYVATDDCLVSGSGTIFAVNHGTKGSRVSVLQGLVQVGYQQHIQKLEAGDQATTGGYVSRVPIQEEITWSKNAAKYLALLGEIRRLEREIEAIPGPGLRYHSDLLQYVPDGTVVYAALPNIGSTLQEAGRLFRERLEQSPVLRAWWQRNHGPQSEEFEDVINRIETFSSYLGDELVVAMADKGNQSEAAPVLLANVRRSGLREFLEEQSRQFEAQGQPDLLQVIENPERLVSPVHAQWLVYLDGDRMVATTSSAELRQEASLLRQPQSSHFRQTAFYQNIIQSYQEGAGWLFSLDMEQILGANVHNSGERSLPPGLSDVKFLVVERREVGKTETRASLTFAPRREGMAAWLAEPAPMGSLDFVSPEASFAAAWVMKDPRSVMEEIIQFAETSDPTFHQHLAELESGLGVSLLDDISAPLGGDMTIALDGPLVPVPSWKIVVETYDANKVQSTLAKLVDGFNRREASQTGKLQIAERRVGSQTYFRMASSGQFAFEIDYTFVDNYWVVAPSEALLARAIQNRQAGYTLSRSSAFQAQLPVDTYTNFSAILYHNVAPAMTSLSDQLKALGGLSREEQQEVEAFTANSTPGLIYVYGAPDRIVVASSTGFMGLHLNALLALSEGHPILFSHFDGRRRAAGTGETGKIRDGDKAQ